MLQMAATDTSTAYSKHTFPQMQQNNAANFLIIMSKNDPFEAKWTIIAKAYSSCYILNTCRPKLSVINVKSYFRKIGHSKLQSIVPKY
jgi:hypothetical protein